MNKIRHFILSRPQVALIILAVVYAIVTALYPMFNKPLDAVETTPSLHSAIDERIAFSPVWIIPYVIWYFFLPSVALTLMFKDKRQCGVTLLTMTLGVLLCYLTYSVFQTQVPRPDVPGDDLFSRLVRLIYSIDQPYNAFPSIHVLVTYALMLGTAKAKDIKKAAKAAIWVVGWSIILSTVFVKQHVAADIFGGIVLAQFLHWLLAHFLGLWLVQDIRTEARSI
jgi:membrane-associated phospholipid phosphatase